jgi:hypothetical protein
LESERDFTQGAMESARSADIQQAGQTLQGGYLDVARDRQSLDEQQFVAQQSQEAALLQRQDEQMRFMESMVAADVNDLMGSPMGGPTGGMAGPEVVNTGGAPGQAAPGQMDSTMPDGQSGAAQPQQTGATMPMRLSPSQATRIRGAVGALRTNPAATIQELASIRQEVEARELGEAVIGGMLAQKLALANDAMTRMGPVGQSRMRTEVGTATRLLQTLMSRGTPDSYRMAEGALKDLQSRIDLLADERTISISIPGITKPVDIPFSAQGQGRNWMTEGGDAIDFWKDVAKQRVSDQTYGGTNRYGKDIWTPKTPDEIAEEVRFGATLLAIHYGNWMVPNPSAMLGLPGDPRAMSREGGGNLSMGRDAMMNGEAPPSAPSPPTAPQQPRSYNVTIGGKARTLTDADIERYATERNLTVEEVKAALGIAP